MALKSQLSLYCYAVAPNSATAVVEYASQIEDLSFSSVAPGGCGDLSAKLRLANLRLPRPELGLFARVAVMAGPDCVWLGEITEAAQTLDSAGEYLAISALGVGNCLRDDPLTRAYTNKTVNQIISDQWSLRAAYLGLDSNLSQVFPDNPVAHFSPAYVNRTFEEVIADCCMLAGDYQWGVWPYVAQPGAHRDAWGFPMGQLVAYARDTTTTAYQASYANHEIIQHTITPSAERAYNVIAIGYADLTLGPGTATATDSRLNNDGTQGAAPFRRRKFSRDLAGISTISSSQAQSIANQYLSLYKNITNKVGLTLAGVSDSNGHPLALWRVQADRNILVPELAPRGTQLPLTASAGINQFYIVKATYSESSSGAQTLALECDNFLDAAELQIARLQLSADAQARNRATTGVTQAAGAPEMGQCGARMNNVAAGLTVAVWVPFRAIMQNVPTSITLNVTSSTNAGSIAAVSITAYGFVLQWVPATSGNSLVFATYQTVGN